MANTEIALGINALDVSAYKKRQRQYRAFRIHILRMTEWKKVHIGDLEHQIESWGETCARQHDEIVVKNREIAELRLKEYTREYD